MRALHDDVVVQPRTVSFSYILLRDRIAWDGVGTCPGWLGDVDQAVSPFAGDAADVALMGSRDLAAALVKIGSGGRLERGGSRSSRGR